MSTRPTVADNGITPGMIESLRQTKPWVRLLSILGFVGSAFMVMGGLFVITASLAGATIGGSLGRSFRGPSFLIIGILYLLFAVLYLFPSFFLFRYASAIAAMLRGETVHGMEQALAAQKTFWRFVGIMAVVVLALYVIILVVVFVVAVASG